MSDRVMDKAVDAPTAAESLRSLRQPWRRRVNSAVVIIS